MSVLKSKRLITANTLVATRVAFDFQEGGAMKRYCIEVEVSGQTAMWTRPDIGESIDSRGIRDISHDPVDMHFDKSP